ncbi:MAG TPA: ATP-binding protein, partial [Burkholderiaceae bacterium]|nr:ATP-binding protein [Burkholderiaceae bacterium]
QSTIRRVALSTGGGDAPGGLWRVYSTQLGDTVVQVAQPLAGRRHFAARVALRTVAPLLLVLPLLGALVWVVVGAGLAPVRRVAAELQSRDVQTLQPIAEAGLPSEIRPLTHSLNDLLERLARALQAQRAFVADAAHELRTPLTALKLQIQLAERARNDDERREAFAMVRGGLERSIRLVSQLLTLARQEPGAFEQTTAPVDLAALVRTVIADLAVTAGERGATITFDPADGVAATVQGHADSLRILVGNLLENALRHNPPPARIEVSLAAADGGGVRLRVRDHGPGIPPQALQRVFDRFYRVVHEGDDSPGGDDASQGSGLGLAIVRSIAERHRAHIELRNAEPGPGLIADVMFPAPSAVGLDGLDPGVLFRR